MIGRANRFHGYGSLRYVYRQGHTVRGAHMGLRYCQNPKRQTYRLAVVVSKKINKSAVVRNRMRRRIYEAFRNQAVGFGTYDMVVTVFQTSLEELSAADLAKEVNDLIKQAGLQRPDSLTNPSSHAIIETKET